VPRPLERPEIAGVVDAFGAAARRALDGRFDVVEIHAAHGYLLHEFYSPLVNTRTDEYGGPFDNRVRLCLEVVDAVRRVWPERLPLFVRILLDRLGAGGWDVDQSVELARRMRQRGVDLVDCSSGGAVHDQQIAVGPGIRCRSRIGSGATRRCHGRRRADHGSRSGRRHHRRRQADVVLLARELLRDPYWPLHAADALGQLVPWPAQYLRAAHRVTPAR
jgi:2,4-dienoyl-CoA reductase-like NADH-dependent reductase (Old Yellow Enzyme family)